MKVDYSIVAQATERCNMRCVYCYLKEKKPRDMSIETAERIVRALMEYNNKYAHFTWVGGEPLLRDNGFYFHLKEFSQKHNPRNLNISHSIQTNGLILSPIRGEALLREGFGLGVSYDGSLDLQEKLRGSGNAKRSRKILRNIGSMGKKVGIISVLTSSTIGRENEVYTNLSRLTRHARLNFYTPTGEGLHMVSDLLPSKEDALESMLRFYHLWKNDETDLDLNPFKGMVRGFFLGWTRTCDSSAYSCYRILSSDVEGNIFLCSRSTHFPQTRLGNIYTDQFEDMIGSRTHQIILDRYLALKDGKCKDCKWLSLCSGGCPIESLSTSGDIMDKTYYCEVKGGLLNEIEKDLKDEKNRRILKRKIGL